MIDIFYFLGGLLVDFSHAQRILSNSQTQVKLECSHVVKSCLFWEGKKSGR